MNNFILGSGLIGLITRHILGNKYTLIPFKKSRYYSFPIPIADNEVILNQQTIDLFRSLHILSSPAYFPVAVSMAGELFFNKNIWINPVVDKIYGEDAHPLAAQLLSADITAHSEPATKLYMALVEQYADDIHSNAELNVTSISSKAIVINGIAHEFNQIISTIPLNILLSLCNVDHNLKSKDYHVFLVATDQFNLEGAKRCFIADAAIPFWKVNVYQDAYQFFSNGRVENAEVIFSMLTSNRFKVLASTSVNEAFPYGPPPNDLINKLKIDHIECIGSNARWDYFCDIATSLNHILRLKNV